MTPKESESVIQHWVENCAAVCDLEMLAAPPSPPRSHGFRMPNPSKLYPETYRTRNMHHAGVFVDTLDLPPAIDDEVRRILGVDSWEDRVVATVYEPETATYLTGLATAFQTGSRTNARMCSLEGNWKASLFGLVRSLEDLWPGALRATVSKMAWNPDLKPTGPSLDGFQNQDHGGTRTPPSAPPSASAQTASYTQSVASTTSTEAADPYHISTPKPDITIGLANTAFLRRHLRRLDDHQASGSILSDPHASIMGLRFPFLIVEAKGLDGSLSAQNKAAVSGASMLTILKDLSYQAACNAGSNSDCGFQTLDPKLTSPSTTPPAPQSIPTLCFSMVTAGPVHELWVHFEHEGAFHMEFIQLWRTTRERDAREFVHVLARIMEWGRGRFKDCIVEKLDKLAR
ncbi:copper transport accessory [Pyrenophora seminiperda CCB06]|uniref:Copper transport accessory n=1 Tax=Pyrenophora seminiperda CCB06 TaxID=1302712 RepID=A0A3M7M964_9PLEO|nr:copper transport accessory [Pyrenophora seminiperda CCB06]